MSIAKDPVRRLHGAIKGLCDAQERAANGQFGSGGGHEAATKGMGKVSERTNHKGEAQHTASSSHKSKEEASKAASGVRKNLKAAGYQSAKLTGGVSGYRHENGNEATVTTGGFSVHPKTGETTHEVTVNHWTPKK